MVNRTYNAYQEIFRDRPMPYAFVDLDLLNANVEAVIRKAEDKKIRIASKSVRSVSLLKHLFAVGERFQGMMCFTAPEAVYLAQQGFDDLLVAYPAWEEQHIESVLQEIGNGCRIILTVDSSEQVDHLEAKARRFGGQLLVCLDVDMSSNFLGLHFGARRSPVATVREAAILAERIAASQHLMLDGLLGYEAQIAGVTDADPKNPPKNTLIRWLKNWSIREVAERRSALVQELSQRGMSVRFVNGGGTGSLSSTSREEAVTEVTVGSAFYSPALFDYYRDFRYLPAAGFAIQIVRRSQPHIFTCLGGGYVASGAAGSDKLPKPYLPEGARLTASEGAGEVQTPVIYKGREPLTLGDPIFMRHSKAGELCERFNTLLLVSGRDVVDEVTTYRGDGHCFL